MYGLFAGFFIGVLILLASTQTLISLAEKVARSLRISPLIVGITLVAVGTSLPELAVSINAIIRQDAGLAYGNIIGSNIINILLVLPMGIVGGRLLIGRFKTQWNALMLLILTIGFLALKLLPVPIIFISLTLLGLTILLTLGEYHWALLGRKHEDLKFTKAKQRRFLHLSDASLLLLTIVGIIVGSTWVVTTLEQIAETTGISTTILGLSLAALSTSLPEVMATFSSRHKDKGKITIGNILGSNIYNLLLIGGLISLFAGDSHVSTQNWIWLVGSTSLFVIILHVFKGKRVPNWVGFILFGLFFVYIATLGFKL